LKLHSLKLRLIALSILWVIGSLSAAASVLQYLFVSTLERNVHEDLEAAMTRLVALIDLNSSDIALTAPLPDPRYDTPLGGRYWQIENIETGQISRSRSLWDMTISTRGASDGELVHFVGDDNWHLLYLARAISVNEQALVLTVGLDHGPIHDAADLFLRDTIRLFLVLALVILGAAWLQLRFGLAPLDRLRAAIDKVRHGQVQRLERVFPAEVEPLVDEVNALLDEREGNLERARQRASDLAHGLKTPLAALHGIALRVREGGNQPDADLIDDLAFEMSKRVDYQMRMSAIRLRTSAHVEKASLSTAVIRTITVLKKTSRGEDLHWLAELPEDCLVDIHRQDLIELVGIILENAAKWARSRITVRSTVTGDVARLEIADDGPGIPEHHLARLGLRGTRLDESVPGTGQGLAIAREIIAVNKGNLEFSRAAVGGLSVLVTLPRIVT
jgi:signal transduction histidine kinase